MFALYYFAANNMAVSYTLLHRTPEDVFIAKYLYFGYFAVKSGFALYYFAANIMAVCYTLQYKI
jgi:hypothetical protein